MTDDKFLLDNPCPNLPIGQLSTLILVSSLNRCTTAVKILYEL